MTLTIDERIQYVAERELKKAVEEESLQDGKPRRHGPENRGNPGDDKLSDAINPNDRPEEGENLSTRLNLAVSAPFEPGSVFKVITVAAGLETTNITPHTIIPCGNGRMTLFKRVIHDHNSYSALVGRGRAREIEQHRRDPDRPQGRQQAAVGIRQAVRVRNSDRHPDAGRIARDGAVLAEVAPGRDRLDRDGPRNHHHDSAARAGLLPSSPTAECW